MPDSRPNILLIMTDQQRGDCLSCAGHPVLMTPNMDTIAENGVRFTQAYSTCPTCIAARRSLLSGQFPRSHGMVGYRDGVPWNAPVTLPAALTRAGYQTALVGRSMHQYPERARFGYEQMVIHSHGSTSDYERWLAQRAPDSGGWMGFGITNND
ncbi:MAG: sulfatase-like hydrolase/transferase, partial [Anaerolineae bacterium]